MPSRAAFFASPQHLTRGPAPRVGRAGFTLPEILIVIVMISVLALVAIPRFATANGRRHMESARMRIAAALATARQGAIQRGQPIRFRVDNDSLRVTLFSHADTLLLSPVPLNTLYKVTIDKPSQPYEIVFGARGFATAGLPDAENYIVLKRSGVPDDTVTVSRYGMVKQ